MSYNEIKELRQAGKLEEALEMVTQALEIEPDNIWYKREAAWTYYGFLKKSSSPESYDFFIENLIKIKDLQLPEDENMVYDNSAWQVGSILNSLKKQGNVDYGKINRLYEIIKEFHFTRPSEAYSFIYKMFHKGYQNWSKYLEFANWWNFENFRPEDYLKEEFNGKISMAVAQRAYIAYSKKLLEGEAIDPFGQQKVLNKDKIQSFLPQLDKVIDDQPQYEYPPYYKAKLLLALGDDENVLSSFLPFAKQKRNNFWVWEMMAEIFSSDKEIQFACYCKALSLKSPEDYLVNVREDFAAILIERERFNEAKREIEMVVETRNKHEWKLSNRLKEWIKQDWFVNTKGNKNNKEFYSQHLKQAEELLYQDVSEELVAVEFVNTDKKVLNFVKSKQKSGFFKYAGFMNKPKIGDLLKVRFDGDGRNGFYRILSIEKADNDQKSDAIKSFEGQLRLIPPHNFGFVDDVYFHPKQVQSNKLTDGQTVKGKAILSFNKKKNEWGWKAISFEK